MIKLLINIFILSLLLSCETAQKKDIEEVINKTKKIVEKKIVNEDTIKKNEKKIKNNNIFYLVGEPFYLEGVKYTPEENYNYSEIGLATYYGKELHNKKTANNDYN